MITILYYTILYYTILYYTILYYTILYTIPSDVASQVGGTDLLRVLASLRRWSSAWTQEVLRWFFRVLCIRMPRMPGGIEGTIGAMQGHGTRGKRTQTVPTLDEQSAHLTTRATSTNSRNLVWTSSRATVRHSAQKRARERR